MTQPQDIELYMMGEFDGDKDALEKALADDPSLAAMFAGEAKLEMLLRDAAASGTFCPACNDLVSSSRCDACGAAVEPGGYVVERVLVSNAHGRMYVARDADGKQVALKELAFVQSPTLEVIGAFERETKLLRALEHPAIPRFVASFEEGSGVHARYYLAQELVTGDSLEQTLENHFYSETELVDLARQVLDVLVYLQGLSPMVIHRDIKPANLIVKPDGKIAVVDFGAAHVQGSTAGSTSIGTFGYMPIEQLAGIVDATTDPYALGASLLHLSSRREPWRILQGLSFDGINVSVPMRDWLAKVCAAEPTDRFTNATAARDALEQVARGEPIVSIASRAKKTTRVAATWWRPVALAAAALALVASGIGVHALIVGNGEVRVESPPTPNPAPFPSSGRPEPVPREIAKLRIGLEGTPTAELSIDGAGIGTVRSGFELPFAPGRHLVVLTAPGGQSCAQAVSAELGKAVDVACRLHQTPANVILTAKAHVDADHPNGKFKPDECVKCHKAGSDVFEVTKAKLPFDDLLPAGKPIDLEFKNTPLHDVMRVVAGACKLNLVLPDSIDAKITVTLKKAPCDQALEVLLEAHGLWYRYSAAGNMLRVAPRHQLDRDAEDARARRKTGDVDDDLPKGPPIDVDFKEAPLHDMLRMFSDMAGVNIVVPDTIDAKVTLRLVKVPWDVALRAMLDAHGLWYRYRPNGKLLRIAPRHELDREADDARARAKTR